MAKGFHVALLRGVNVGKGNRISMADLRTVLENLGYGDVRTLLNSGNVVFTAGPEEARDASRRIEQALEENHRITTRVMVLSRAELVLIARENTLAETADNHSRLLVAFPAKRADLKLLALLQKQDWGREELAVGKAAAYLWIPSGVIQSLLAKAVDRALGSSVTSRNWATVQKLLQMMEG